MIVWMRRHARGISGELQGDAASALARGSTTALVGMAFLAVLREGLETSVFLLAAFQDVDRHGGGRHRRNPRPRRRGRDRARHLPRRRANQPRPLLPRHRPRPRLRRRRAARDRRCTPPTRPAGSTACRARRSTSPGWSSPGTISGSLLTGMLGLQPKRRPARHRLARLRGADGLYVLWPSRRTRPARAAALEGSTA